MSSQTKRRKNLKAKNKRKDFFSAAEKLKFTGHGTLYPQVDITIWDFSKMENSRYAIKIQAIWRSYKSRKGEIQPCTSCGYPMAVPLTVPLKMPCMWCQYNLDLLPKQIFARACHSCKSWDCCGCEDGEPYIPCCICGANCDGSDYESWRVCSRSCLVEPDRRW